MAPAKHGADGSGISRRQFLVGTAAAATALALPRPALAQENAVVYCGWGGSSQDILRDAFMVPFGKKTGIRVLEASPTDYAKAKAMVEAKRVEWDVLQCDWDFIYRGRAENLLEPLDYKVISTKDVFPEAVHEHGIGYALGATVMTYRTDAYPPGKGPRTWAEFWDVKRFPGRRALPKDPYFLFPLAAAADGVPREKMYPMDVDRVFRSLERIRPHVFKWWETGGQSQQLITDKEADLVAGWTSRMFVVQKQGAPIHVELNEGAPWGDAWVVLRGAPHRENAMKFIAFAIQHEEGMAINSRAKLSGFTNARTGRLLEPAVAHALVSTPENRAKLLPGGDQWWGTSRAEMIKRMTAWLLK
ncbi:MAG TPA: ABC transporter substrate-binding protein [Candidatus Methylomirabilis sp.]|nr:ABC transporter substrate-binding protein [Candidatus Methylomirabilis sp.]